LVTSAPLIRAFTAAEFRCLGFDVDQSEVDKLKAGQSYIKHIDSFALAQLIHEKRFDPTIDTNRLAEADCIIICVPTPLSESRDPDLSYIEGTAPSHRQGTAPGTTGRAGNHDPSDDNAHERVAGAGGSRGCSPRGTWNSGILPPMRVVWRSVG
jgi:hypothetical protein